MKKLSGLVLDHYDDLSGEVLRSIFPTEESVPEVIKQAHFIPPEERATLPPDVFALELVDGPVVMRKFACTDPGNTALSVEYFLKTAHRLPEEAQKVAAKNLITACEWYDIDPPEALQKVAIGLSGLATLAMAPSVVKGTKDQVQRNTAVARTAGSAINPQGLSFKNPMSGQ